jgi:hypothetical protein
LWCQVDLLVILSFCQLYIVYDLVSFDTQHAYRLFGYKIGLLWYQVEIPIWFACHFEFWSILVYDLVGFDTQHAYRLLGYKTGIPNKPNIW